MVVAYGRLSISRHDRASACTVDSGCRLRAPDPDGVDAAAGLGVFRWGHDRGSRRRVAVFIKTERADFNQLFQVLMGETAVSGL